MKKVKYTTNCLCKAKIRHSVLSTELFGRNFQFSKKWTRNSILKSIGKSLGPEKTVSTGYVTCGGRGRGGEEARS